MTITASTSKTWIKPPIVVEETNPSTQRINKIIAIVSNISASPVVNLELVVSG